ncbi:protein phosphatase 1 regulatory subunit 1B [Austrofundulus limnaeus]|uniref:Protein phosphatase 1 regulatory subunit 1B n=1 Tax=Austrofundulus limnaeus TaxID=52670 RepID=A0A2I4B5S1_AUSLI|nr:PREDICTED: protein phosphatase 1 regulatory subunit 1B-like [Austrofundulus limnaeus]
MDPLLPADPDMMERESDQEARKKIQFSVPSPVALQLDPRQVELIRRRRPTPATLFRLTDQPSPEEDSGPHQWVLGENGALKAKLVHMSTYQPPSLKAVQMMAQAHLSSLNLKSDDSGEPSSGEEEEQHDDDDDDDEEEEEKQQTASATYDSGEASEPLRDPRDLPDSSCADATLHHDDQDTATRREGEKGDREN